MEIKILPFTAEEFVQRMGCRTIIIPSDGKIYGGWDIDGGQSEDPVVKKLILELLSNV